MTKKEELRKDFPPQSSQRFQQLHHILGLALQKSRTHFNVDQAMMAIYGADDVASFGGQDAVRNFFQFALDKIEKQVQGNMQEYCQQQRIDIQLWTLESIAEKLEREAVWEQFLEDQDRLSAQKALEQSKLPKGYSAEDVVHFRMHQQLSAEQAALEKELAEITHEIAELEQAQQNNSETLQQQVKTTSKLTQQMEKAADVTSGISK